MYFHNLKSPEISNKGKTACVLFFPYLAKDKILFPFLTFFPSSSLGKNEKKYFPFFLPEKKNKIKKNKKPKNSFKKGLFFILVVLVSLDSGRPF